jgi:hypothetical protein
MKLYSKQFLRTVIGSALLLAVGGFLLFGECERYQGLPGDKTDQYWLGYHYNGEHYRVGLIWNVGKGEFEKVQFLGLAFTRSRLKP